MRQRPSDSTVIWNSAALTRLREGDGAAFNALVETYAAALIRYSANILHSPDIAQEVVQEVFFSFWQNRNNIEPTWDISSHLFGLARRRSIDAIRSMQSSLQRDAAWTAESDSQNNEADVESLRRGESEAIRKEVWNALSTLSERAKDVFMLIWDHDLSYREISARTGLSEQTVRIYASRAMRRLAEELGPKYR